jgi:transcriptional regulator with XRE-family HTH domain
MKSPQSKKDRRLKHGNTPTMATTAKVPGTTSDRSRRRGGKPCGGKQGSEPRVRIRAREQRVVALSDQGWSQEAIAHDLGITQSAVSQILRRVDDRMVGEMGAQHAHHRTRIFRRLDYLSREGCASWEQSKAGHTTRTQTKRQDATGAPVVTQQVTVDDRPNARLLEEVRLAEQAKAGLLGFGRSGDRGVTPPPEAAVLSTEELTERVAALLGGAVTPADGDQEGVADAAGEPHADLGEPDADDDTDGSS